MDISDQDIEIVLYEENVRDFLNFIDDETFGNKYTVVNLLLFLFYSSCTKKKDWIEDIIYVIENEILNDTFLAPCVKEHIKKNTNLFQNIRETAIHIKNNGYVKIRNRDITYNMFNDYLNSLYLWCKNTFDIIC